MDSLSQNTTWLCFVTEVDLTISVDNSEMNVYS